MPSIKLAYFDIEGRAEPIRLAFKIAGVPFEDVRVARGEWAALKPKTRYGQLPQLTVTAADGAEQRFSQSLAILRYAGRVNNSGLYPSDPVQALAVDQVVDMSTDLDKVWEPCFYIALVPFAYGRPNGFCDTDEGKAVRTAMRTRFATEEIPRFAGYIKALLDENAVGGEHKFLCGASITIADLAVLNAIKRFTVGYIDDVPTTCLDAFPEVKAWMARVLALPAVARHYEERAAAKAAK